MHFRQKLTFMALGSILTIAGYLLATLTSDVTAQSETDKSEPLFVNEIVCRKLRVVDENDKTRTVVDISSTSRGSGYMNVNRADGQNVVRIGEVLNGGFMDVGRPDGETAVFISSNDAENGGLVSVQGKEGGSTQLSVNEYGGNLGIFGKTDNKTRVQLSINEKGHGTINTWDKNRYRTRP